MKYVRVTCPINGEQYHKAMPVLAYDQRVYDNNGVIVDCCNENSLREAIAILRKHAVPFPARDRRDFDYLEISVMASADGKGFRLLTSTWSWAERPSYYAGIITGVRRVRRSRRKRRAKAKKAA